MLIISNVKSSVNIYVFFFKYSQEKHNVRDYDTPLLFNCRYFKTIKRLFFNEKGVSLYLGTLRKIHKVNGC